MSDPKKPEEKADPKKETAVLPKVAYTPPKWTPPSLADSRLFWIGTLPCSPMQNISTSHMDFPGFSEAHGKNPATGATMYGAPRLGKTVRLTDDKLKQILNELTYEVIVEKAVKGPNGAFVRGEQRTLKDAAGTANRYMQMTEEVATAKPLGCFVYIVPVASETEWPTMEQFVKLDEVREDDPLSWGQPRQWKLDKLPKPVIQLEAVA